MDLQTAIGYYRRGWEDCAEVVEDLIQDVKDLEHAKLQVRKVLVTVKERKIHELEAQLGL